MIRFFIIGMLFLLVACSNSQQPEDHDVALIRATPTVIADNLQVPWSIQKLNDTYYISERPGGIMKVENGVQERQRVELEKPLSDAAEAGLLGFVLHPNFSENRQAFAYYTYDDNGSPLNRVVLLTLQDDVWRESKILLDRIPSDLFIMVGG